MCNWWKTILWKDIHLHTSIPKLEPVRRSLEQLRHLSCQGWGRGIIRSRAAGFSESPSENFIHKVTTINWRNTVLWFERDKTLASSYAVNCNCIEKEQSRVTGSVLTWEDEYQINMLEHDAELATNFLPAISESINSALTSLNSTFSSRKCITLPRSLWIRFNWRRNTNFVSRLDNQEFPDHDNPWEQCPLQKTDRDQQIQRHRTCSPFPGHCVYSFLCIPLSTG